MGPRRIFERLKLRYGSQATVIHTLRAMGVQIGERCRINTTGFGSEPWLVKIGNHVSIAQEVSFLTHGLTWVFRDTYESLTSFGAIEVKDNVQIGPRATIFPNVTIGPNAVVGACSVVTKDVPPNVVVAGSPARVISTLAEYEQKCVAGHIAIPVDREAARRVLEAHFWGKREGDGA